jgi:HPt (histidine-containing phosphotransfer) domain-containing protein
MWAWTPKQDFAFILRYSRDTERQPKSIEKTARSLKGELGSMGAPELPQKTHNLEGMGRKGDLEEAAELFVALESDLTVLVTAVRSLNGGGPDPELALTLR